MNTWYGVLSFTKKRGKKRIVPRGYYSMAGVAPQVWIVLAVHTRQYLSRTRVLPTIYCTRYQVPRYATCNTAEAVATSSEVRNCCHSSVPPSPRVLSLLPSLVDVGFQKEQSTLMT